MNIRPLIDTRSMGPYQWLIIGIALFINMLDGFDLSAMAFAASAVAAEFGLSGSTLGWLLTAAGLGSIVGSLGLAPQVDRWGRRTLILLGLAIDGLGLVGSALAPNFFWLLVSRAVTGVGVGAILVAVTVLVSEFSNLRHRGLAVAIFASGYGVGAAFSGWLAKNYIATHGWGILFWVGAALTGAALAVTYVGVPESPEFLVARGNTAGAQSVTARLGLGTDFVFTAGDSADDAADAAPSSRLSDVLTSELRSLTLRLWVAFALGSSAFGFASQWTPKLLANSGLSADQGIIGGIMLSFGGTLGSLIFGVLTTRVHARRLLIATCVTAAVTLVGFILSTNTPGLMFALGVVAGMFLNGCITGFYTVIPASYPSHLRTTGMGAANGVTRLATLGSPIVVGYLVDGGWSPLALYCAFAALTLVGGACLIGLRPGTHIVIEKKAAAPTPVAV